MSDLCKTFVNFLRNTNNMGRLQIAAMQSRMDAARSGDQALMRTLVSYARLVDPVLVAVLCDAGFDAKPVRPENVVAAAADEDATAIVVAVRSTFEVEVIRSVRRAAPHCRILGLVDDAGAREFVIDALVAGADGFAFPHTPADIVKPLRLLVAGETVIPRVLTELLADALARRAGGLQRSHRRLNLTHSESAVCRCLERGMTVREIGEFLGISPTTARRHIGAAMHKGGVKSRDELLAILVPARAAA
jgi:DNA-binding NarL/FixJ family response regulator